MKDEFLNPSGLSRVWESIKNWVTGQHFAKETDIPEIPVTDVTVNGESVLNDGTAEITIPDAPEIPVTDVTVGGTSVVENGTAVVPEIPTVPTDISAFNNDVGYITNVTSVNYKTFPENWETNEDITELIRDINDDETAEPGMSYMGTVYLNDLPANMGQAEMMVDIMSELHDLGKVIRFTLTSTERYPYHWEYTSAYRQAGRWRGYIPDNGYIFLVDKNGVEWKLGVKTNGELEVTLA